MNRYLIGPAVVLLVLLFSGVAYAATINGTSASETINGTNNADVIDATQGGADSVFGKDGKDTIYTNDGVADDTVNCGAGTDTATVDEGDSTTNCDGNVTRIPISPPPPPPPGDVTCPSGGINVMPSQDLAAVAANNSGSKTYCLAPGTYTVSSNIKVEGTDYFLGLSADRSQVKVKSNGTQSYGSNGAIVTGSTVDHVFETGGSNGATFENLDISGGVHDNSCEPNCGRGIGSGGPNMTIKNVRSHHNENAGIGAPGASLHVYDSEFDHNGNVDSARDGGPVSAAGIKSTDSMFIYNSNIHDNYWTGVWCDIECNAFEVHDSVASNNGKAGIHDEISTGPAVFEGNTIQNNGSLTAANQHTGLLIVSSRNAEAFGNTFGGNVSEGVKIMEDSRDPVLGNISVHDNAMNGDKLVGCGLSGVTCTNNT